MLSLPTRNRSPMSVRDRSSVWRTAILGAAKVSRTLGMMSTPPEDAAERVKLEFEADEEEEKDQPPLEYDKLAGLRFQKDTIEFLRELDRTSGRSDFPWAATDADVEKTSGINRILAQMPLLTLKASGLDKQLERRSLE